MTHQTKENGEQPFPTNYVLLKARSGGSLKWVLLGVGVAVAAAAGFLALWL